MYVYIFVLFIVMSYNIYVAVGDSCGSATLPKPSSSAADNPDPPQQVWHNIHVYSGYQSVLNSEVRVRRVS